MRWQIFVFDILKEVGCHSMEKQREKTFKKKKKKERGQLFSQREFFTLHINDAVQTRERQEFLKGKTAKIFCNGKL